MKKLLILLLIVPVLASAQIPKKASAIAVKYDSDSIAYSEGLKMLKRWGYVIENASLEGGFINTKQKEQFALYVSVYDSTLFFTGEWTSFSSIKLEACYCGIVGDKRRKYFVKMKGLIDSEGLKYSYR